MPVARKVWQQIRSGSPAATARRFTMAQGVVPAEGPVVSVPDFAGDGAEERPLPVAGDARGLDVGVEVRLGVVVGGHLVELAALLVEAEPPPLAVGVVVLDLHAEDGGDAGEAEDHDADEGPVPQAERGSVPSSAAFDAMLSRSVRASSAERTGVLPFLTTCLGALTEAAGLTGRTWPVTSQSKSIRMAARCCLTEGAASRALSSSM